MRYIVKSVVCDYGVYQRNDNQETLIDICNSLSNAELIADILNTDLGNEKYKVVKKSKVDKAKTNIEVLLEAEKQKDGTYTDVGQGIAIALGLINNEIGE